ncbi:hypothetical protein BDV35DRAFT_383807 [Aspergillus flavus]|uniref:Uncharacterized protein n=1 Tax=Aspergillus flavus TaxID=5059 RepID=A0A5N6GK88_ASPFL|nr:hypothetical protein BDV35DRAFT_383807 [Aspergillus flavus]
MVRKPYELFVKRANGLVLVFRNIASTLKLLYQLWLSVSLNDIVPGIGHTSGAKLIEMTVQLYDQGGEE